MQNQKNWMLTLARVAFSIVLGIFLISAQPAYAADTPVGKVPIGTIMAYAGDASGNEQAKLERQGWLVCNGEQYLIEDYSDLFDVIGSYYGTASKPRYFKLPDLRGQFLRGVDHGAGVDPDAKDRQPIAPGGNSGDKVGSKQDDAMQQHHHFEPERKAFLGNGLNPNGQEITFAVNDNLPIEQNVKEAKTSSETRPKNIAVNWIIKARDVD